MNWYYFKHLYYNFCWSVLCEKHMHHMHVFHQEIQHHTRKRQNIRLYQFQSSLCNIIQSLNNLQICVYIYYHTMILLWSKLFLNKNYHLVHLNYVYLWWQSHVMKPLLLILADYLKYIWTILSDEYLAISDVVMYSILWINHEA